MPTQHNRDTATEATPHRPPTTKEWAIITFATAFALLQVILPVTQLWAPRPSRFGWQMFAAVPEPQIAFVHTRRGAIVPARVQTHARNWRADVRADMRQFASHLCREMPAAQFVSYWDGSATASLQCR